MSKTEIIINVYGGLVQDVYCSDPDAEVTLVDYDVDPSMDDERGVVLIDCGDRQERVFVDRFTPHSVEAIQGTDVEKAIDSAGLTRH